MPVDIKSAECETLGGVEEFTPRRVVRHPAHLQGVLRREMHSTLHGNCDRTTGSKNGNSFPAYPGREKLYETGINPGAKLGPGLYALRRDLAAHPLANDSFEQLLKSRAFFGSAGRRLKRRVEISDSLVVLDQHGQAAFEHCFSLIFVELR